MMKIQSYSNYHLTTQRDLENSFNQKNNLLSKNQEKPIPIDSATNSSTSLFDWIGAGAKAIGYTPNQDGFFHNDLNAKLGIPSSIKIPSDIVVRYDLSQALGYYNNINMQASIQNSYQAFSKLSNQGIEALISQAKQKPMGDNQSLYDSLLKIPQFIDNKGELNQSGKFTAFMVLNDEYIVGDLTIAGEIQRAGSKYANILDENDNLLGMNILDRGKAGALLRKSINEITPEEFRAQWEELRKEYQAKNESQLKGIGVENVEIEKINNPAEQKGKNPFKPIEGKSQNQTYQDTNVFNTLQFLQNQQKANLLSFLFHQSPNVDSSFNRLDNFIIQSFLKTQKMDREV